MNNRTQRAGLLKTGNIQEVVAVLKVILKPLMELFQQDLVHLANHLKLLNERMVLVNPKFDE